MKKKQSSKQKKIVKGWGVFFNDGEVTYTYASKMDIFPMSIFKNRHDARIRSLKILSGTKVIPVEISYDIPLPAKSKKK